MTMKIPANVRMRRLWADIRRKIPFLKSPHFTPEGQALIMHMRNLYAGDLPYSTLARELVDDAKKRFKIDDDRKAVEILYLHFYGMGLIDELDLFELKQLSGN